MLAVAPFVPYNFCTSAIHGGRIKKTGRHVFFMGCPVGWLNSGLSNGERDADAAGAVIGAAHAFIFSRTRSRVDETAATATGTIASTAAGAACASTATAAAMVAFAIRTGIIARTAGIHAILGDKRRKHWLFGRGLPKYESSHSPYESSQFKCVVSNFICETKRGVYGCFDPEWEGCQRGVEYPKNPLLG